MKDFTFKEYQKVAKRTALFDELNFNPLLYVTLGLAGESGEVVEKIRRLFVITRENFRRK